MTPRLVLLAVGALILAAMVAPGAAHRAAAQEESGVTWWVVASAGGQSGAGTATLNATLGQPIIGAAQGGGVSLASGFWNLEIGPTSVHLVSFEAAAQGAAILVTWETSQEIDNLGFNLYRAESQAGPMARLNEALIPTQVPPGSPFGAAYEWLDEDGLEPGQEYYYWLEDVDLYGRSTLHGPVQATAEGEDGEGVYLPLIRR